MQIQNVLRGAEYVLMFIGLWALEYWSIALWKAKVYQGIEAREFMRRLHARPTGDVKTLPVQSTAKPNPQRSEGAVIASLNIPRLGLSTIVVGGVRDRDLGLAAGHIPGTSFPGQRGNVGIAGHRDTFFRPCVAFAWTMQSR